MRTIHLLALPMTVGITMQAQAAPMSLEFHVSEAAATPLTFELPLKGTRESVHLSKATALTLKDISKAAVVPDSGGKPNVLLFLTPDGAKRLGQVTGENIGKRLGIVVDGKLVLAPEIKMALMGDKMFLGAGYADAEAKELTERINKAVAKPASHH
jgi:preprotein translocase subunit SecD